MLVKLIDVDDSFIARLKLVTKQSTASKSFIASASGYLDLVEEHKSLLDQLDSHKELIAIYESRFKLLRKACKSMLEDIDQADFFNEV